MTIFTSRSGWLARTLIGCTVTAAGVTGMTAPASAAHSTATEVFSHDVYVLRGSGDLTPADPRSTPPEAQLFNVAGHPSVNSTQ